MKNFLAGRLELVDRLESEIPEASYADIVLIITAVLSACAAIRWPGTRIDRKRFIELLINHTPERYHTSWISIPVLINKGYIAERDTPYGRPGHEIRIFCGSEIDINFQDAKEKYPNIPVKVLRKHSYAFLIYEWLRCGYSHEYCTNENITPVQASSKNAHTSYIGRSTPLGMKRMLSFHLNYLKDLAIESPYHVLCSNLLKLMGSRSIYSIGIIPKRI